MKDLMPLRWVGILVVLGLLGAMIWALLGSPRRCVRVTLRYSQRQSSKLDGWDSPEYTWNDDRAARADETHVHVKSRDPDSIARADGPLVSIVTPSYNQAAFLEATLASVATQTYPNIEHIVMDGGSTDGSVAIIEAWAASHSLRWTSGRDGGQAAAIQAGVEMATGEIVAWLNSDDVYLDSHVVEDAVRALEGGAAVVTGGGWYITPNGRRLRHIPVFSDRLRFDTLRYVDWVLQPATFFRRDVLLQYPLDTSLHFAFDWDLFIRLAREHELVAIEQDLAGYRLHGSGKTESGGRGRRRELLAVTARYNGRSSPHYALLAATHTAEMIGEALPRPIGFVVHAVATRVALMSNLLTNGRGIQY